MCTILAIESSCDDTSASIIISGKIVTNIIINQEIHKIYGGVVPEYASRAHQRAIVSTVEQAMLKAGIRNKDLDAIAFTQGPGLIGSLLVASSFAKGLSLALNIPIIGVDHLQAHVLANFIDNPKPEFPFLCLLISGGHTQIIKVSSHLKYEILGQTLDDAAGEAFDKAAKIIDLPYPGGASIDKNSIDGNVHQFEFPTPKTKSLDFSFSGLKTSFLYFIRDNIKDDVNFVQSNLSDICASYQHRIVSYLLTKLEKATNQTDITRVALAGGVAANSYLRKMIRILAKKNNWELYVPDLEYCTDNAAMIAIAAHFKFKNGLLDNREISTYAK